LSKNVSANHRGAVHFVGLSKLGAGGLAQFLGIFQKRAKIKDLENFRFFTFVLWEVMFSAPFRQWGTFCGYKF